MKYHVKILNVNIEIDVLIWKMFIYIKWQKKKKQFTKKNFALLSHFAYMCVGKVYVWIEIEMEKRTIHQTLIILSLEV